MGNCLLGEKCDRMYFGCFFKLSRMAIILLKLRLQLFTFLRWSVYLNWHILYALYYLLHKKQRKKMLFHHNHGVCSCRIQYLWKHFNAVEKDCERYKTGRHKRLLSYPNGVAKNPQYDIAAVYVYYLIYTQLYPDSVTLVSILKTSFSVSNTASELLKEQQSAKLFSYHFIKNRKSL